MTTTSRSYPSPIAILADVPEPNNFTAKFQYNFFTPDESVNDSGNRHDQFVNSGREELISLTRTVPRYVKFHFTPVVISRDAVGNNEFISNLGLAENSGDLIRKFMGKIQSEDSFSNQRFTSLNFQDAHIQKKMFSLMTGSVAFTKHGPGSLADLSKKLRSMTSDIVGDDLISDGFNNPQSRGAIFIDPKSASAIASKDVDKINEISLHTQINSKVINTIVKQIVADPMSVFSSEMTSVLSVTSKIQSNALANAHPNILSDIELKTSVIPISEVAFDGNGFTPSVRIIGYIIDKTEIKPNGAEIKKAPIIVSSSRSSSAVDSRVKYNARYVYTIRAIALLQLQAVSDETGRLVIVTSLLSSRVPGSRLVHCIEKVPPPPPADFSVTWDYSADRGRLMWSFPPNSQRDIKHFQVFRRKGVREPFQLIQQFDFDDSVIKYKSGERPLGSLIEKMNSPKTFMIDNDFKKESKFIYAVGCIDAHGYSSNYSVQIMTSFDRFRNRIVCEQISSSGAPKSYPNIYLEEDLFIDTVKTSGMSRMTLFFDPEYLEVTDEHGNDLEVIKYNEDGAAYKIQILNIDAQRSEVVTIKINDTRTEETITNPFAGRRFHSDVVR